MDIKAARRDFYTQKVYLSKKNDKQYTQQKFSEDITYLLDQFIPKATLKQLNKFMEKKFQRIIRSYPDVQKALKKVIKDKINQIPQDISNAQYQKIINYIKERFPQLEYKADQKQKDTFHFQYKDASYINYERVVTIQGKCLKFPGNSDLKISDMKSSNKERPHYIINSTNVNDQGQIHFASSNNIQKIDSPKRGNFVRQVNLILQHYTQFVQKMEQTQYSD